MLAINDDRKTKSKKKSFVRLERVCLASRRTLNDVINEPKISMIDRDIWQKCGVDFSTLLTILAMSSVS